MPGRSNPNLWTYGFLQLNGRQKVKKGKILFSTSTITLSTELIAFCPAHLKLKFIFKSSALVSSHLPDPNTGSYYCPVLNHRTHSCYWSKLISISLPSNTDLLYGFANHPWCNLLIFYIYNFSLLHSINLNRTKHITLCKDAQTPCYILFGCEVLFCSSIKHGYSKICIWTPLSPCEIHWHSLDYIRQFLEQRKDSYPL